MIITDSRFRRVPKTDYICIARDNAATPAIVRLGSLVWEWYLFQAIWESPEIQQMLDENPSPLVLDIGAYIGDTVWLFLTMGCTVWAFEMYEDAFHCLQYNCPDSKNFHMAIGDGGKVNFVEPEANTGAGYCLPSDSGAIETKRIDDLELTTCDLIKIDVEGFEGQVLDGAQQVLRKWKPLVILELNSEALERCGFCERDIYEKLDSLGYIHRVLTFPERVGTTLPWDILCVPK